MSMDTDCIFCRIVGREAEASVVYEDAVTLAFLDLRQFHRGHTLVVPKHHVADIYELDDETGAALMRTIGIVARAVRDEPEQPGLWVLALAVACLAVVGATVAIGTQEDA